MIGLSIINGGIVWCNGPFAAGLWPDWKIFKEGGLLEHLDENKRVEADDGYAAGDPEWCKTRSSFYHPEAARGIRNTVRARHETVNGRIKNFGALSSVYKHNILKHGIFVKAALVLTQLSINRGEKLFEVDGYGDFYSNQEGSADEWPANQIKKPRSKQLDISANGCSRIAKAKNA